MNPPLPIALRMSGYLLFGVVRIYSKKVEYLQHDCNVLRIEISKAYANADINLPEDANQAKYDSITLPDNFALDLIDINDYDVNGSPDSHTRPNEDISFIDHSPAGFSKNRFGTPAGYIKISVGEDASRSPINEGSPVPGSMHMAEISHPHTPPPTVDGVQYPDPNNHLESNFMDEDDVAPLETLRIDNSNYQKSPPISSALPDTMEPDPVIVKEISESNNNAFSNLKDIPDNSGPLSPPRQVTPQESVHSEHENDTVQDSFGTQPLFELAPSSSREKRSAEPAPSPSRGKRPAEPAASPTRVKRRKLKYDKATVLTNEFMKKSIDDASSLKRKRKGVSSFLGVYRLNNAFKKQKVLFDPVITGLCDNLSQMHEDGNVSSKAHLINIEQADPDAMEVGRNSEFPHINDYNMIPLSPPDNTGYSSPFGGDENTPAWGTDIGSKSTQAPTTVGTSVGPTPDPASSIGSFRSDTETPFSQSQHDFDNSGRLSDILEDDIEELSLMEDNDGTPSLRGTPETGSLLPRTRCVAKLIKEKSAATPSSSESFGSVSMKNILQGKTRKVCSRMFFETLVLKSCDLIDVKQDEPYGDISLKVTQKLSKLEFSN